MLVFRFCNTWNDMVKVHNITSDIDNTVPERVFSFESFIQFLDTCLDLAIDIRPQSTADTNGIITDSYKTFKTEIKYITKN